MYDVFTNHWNPKGYTMEDAIRKMKAVNKEYAVGNPKSPWKPAEIVPTGKGGFEVIIERE